MTLFPVSNSYLLRNGEIVNEVLEWNPGSLLDVSLFGNLRPPKSVRGYWFYVDGVVDESVKFPGEKVDFRIRIVEGDSHRDVPVSIVMKRYLAAKNLSILFVQRIRNRGDTISKFRDKS